MRQITRLVLLSIRNHWLGFLPLIILQWALGSFPHLFGELLGMSRREIISWHKPLGRLLFYCALLLCLEKAYLYLAKVPRRSWRSPVVGFMVRWHWLPLTLLLGLQMATTQFAGDTAQLLGWQKSEVFAYHGLIGLVLVIYTLVLFAGAVLFGRTDVKIKSS